MASATPTNRGCARCRLLFLSLVAILLVGALRLYAQRVATVVPASGASVSTPHIRLAASKRIGQVDVSTVLPQASTAPEAVTVSSATFSTEQGSRTDEMESTVADEKTESDVLPAPAAAPPAKTSSQAAAAPAGSSSTVTRLRLPDASAASPPLPKGTSKIDLTKSLKKRSCVGDGDWSKRLVWKPECNKDSGKNEDYKVLEAKETFDLMRDGASIFRFGDGELRLMNGAEQINHGMEVGGKDVRLWLHAAASMGGMARPGAACAGLVGMMDGKAARFAPDAGILKWVTGEGARKYQKTIRQCFPRGTYCSASITRPDHLAGWGESRLVEAWASVFAGKVVLYIRPKGKFADAHEDIFGRATAVIAPDFIDEARRSFKLRGKIMDRIHKELQETKIDVVVLSLGPTATVIAAELACQGVQALDFGSWSRRR